MAVIIATPLTDVVKVAVVGTLCGTVFIGGFLRLVSILTRTTRHRRGRNGDHDGRGGQGRHYDVDALEVAEAEPQGVSSHAAADTPQVANW
jgi:hypothetical protein